MLRIAHCSDLHYSHKHLEEADRCFGSAVDAAIRLGAQAAVLSGDATDHALDVHNPAIERLAWQVRRLADHCPVLMLQGTYSHEPPGTLAIFRLLGGRHPIHVADRIGQVALTHDGRWLPSEGWRFDSVPAEATAVFTCIPTANRATVAAVVGASEAAVAVGQELAALLAGYAGINERSRARGLPTIAVSHGTVSGCVTEHDVPLAGLDHEFTPATLFSAGAQAFLLGHIHRHQHWSLDRRLAAYAGSIGRFHYGEQGDKGFLMWEVGADEARLQLVPTPARRTVDLNFEGKPDLAQVQAAAAQGALDGAFVRVRWTVAVEEREEVDRAAIERALRGAAEIKLEGRVGPLVRARVEGISRRASLADKVTAWAELNGAPARPLLDGLGILSQRSPEDIARDLLKAQLLDVPQCAETIDCAV